MGAKFPQRQKHTIPRRSFYISGIEVKKKKYVNWFAEKQNEKKRKRIMHAFTGISCVKWMFAFINDQVTWVKSKPSGKARFCNFITEVDYRVIRFLRNRGEGGGIEKLKKTGRDLHSLNASKNVSKRLRGFGSCFEGRPHADVYITMY